MEDAVDVNNDNKKNKNSKEEEDDENDDKEEEASLPKLLSALALGVRAVNALPLSTTQNNNDNGDDDDAKDNNDSDDDEDEDDEFAYNMAFPEYASLCHESRSMLSILLSESIQAASASASSSFDGMVEEEEEERNKVKEGMKHYSYDDPMLWEKCADVCDTLLERVEAYVEDVEQEGRLGGSVGGGTAAATAMMVKNAADVARERAKGGYQRLLSGLVDMEKPQITYNFQHTIQNSRTEPFKPAIHPQKPYSITPLSDYLNQNPKEGHGLETRFASLQKFATTTTKKITDESKNKDDDIIAPSTHYSHPYQTEIEQFEYTDWQLHVSNEEELDVENGGLGGTLLKKKKMAKKKDDEDDVAASISKNAVWIDTEEDLKRLTNRIENPDNAVREIALDLEAHSHRSFSGFVCLMQLSLRRPPPPHQAKPTVTNNNNNNNTTETAYDFLIDTLTLRHCLNTHLAPILANPNIVKVMHGADSDIPWLQRDFGLYIVNLFDTGRASRLLQYPSASLAHLLYKYAGVVADKKHQLSDWRQRPLPDDMISYAVSDTLYLLDIYDLLKLELDRSTRKDVSVKAVLDVSRRVCLIRYDKEAFRPFGYQNLIQTKKKRGSSSKRTATTSFTTKQENVLKALYDWRDDIARREDESIQYVCTDSALVRIAFARPCNLNALQSLVNPTPPLMLRYSSEVLDVIKGAASSSVKDEEGKGKSNDAKAAVAAAVTTTSSSSSLPADKISQLRASASPFAFKPATAAEITTATTAASPFPAADDNDGGRRGILSPVLGTEALYKQAGWMTPQGYGGGSVTAAAAAVSASLPNPHLISMEDGGEVTTSATDDDDDDDIAESRGGGKSEASKKPKQTLPLLHVNTANQHFVSNEYTSHSIELKEAKKNNSLPSSPNKNDVDAATDAPMVVTTETSNQMKNNNADDNNNGGKQYYRGKSVDGLGAAREALGQTTNISTAAAARKGDDKKGNSNNAASSSLPTTVEEECKIAHSSALQIREMMSQNDAVLLGLVLQTQQKNYSGGEEFGYNDSLDQQQQQGGDDNDDDGMEEDNNGNEAKEGEEIMSDDIPRSMREIYKISNRNRRRPKNNNSNKNHSSNNNDAKKMDKEESKMPNYMDVDDIEGANRLLASRGKDGKGYFDNVMFSCSNTSKDGCNNGTTTTTGAVVEGGGGSKAKRQRTKQGNSSNNMEDNNNNNNNNSGATDAAKDANIKLMQEVGWIKDEEEAESLAQQQQQQQSGDDNNLQDASSPPTTTTTTTTTNITSSYDYSNVMGSSIAAYNPKKSTSTTTGASSANPFFAGAALTGGVLTHGGGGGILSVNSNKKGGGAGGNKKGGGKGSNNHHHRGTGGSGGTIMEQRQGKRDGSQTFVYRTGTNKR